MNPKPILISISLLIISCLVAAQDSAQFSTDDLAVISKRWAVHQPFADVLLRNGDTLKGQALHFDMDTFFIFPSTVLPYEMDEEILSIPLSDIDRVLLNRGGRNTQFLTTGIVLGITAGILGGFSLSGPGAALILGQIGGGTGGLIGRTIHTTQTVAELKPRTYNINYREELDKLHSWSVFEDTLLLTDDIHLLPVHSRAIRRVFKPKHFRISFALNRGFNALEKNIRTMVNSSGLPMYTEYYQSVTGFEFVDLSWRFKNRWIIGGGLMSNPEDFTNANYYTSNFGEPGIETWEYSVHQTDFRAYTEYVTRPINWFPSQRTELLLGGGIIVSRPTTRFGTFFIFDDGMDYGEYFSSSETHTIFGAQVRASYHIYVAQTISFSVGMEGNLYQNIKMPAFELPESDLEGLGEIPAHTLNYSTVRLKVGAHISF